MTTFRKESEKHKVFVSYYHNDDEKWRKKFDRKFDNIMIPKSVEPGDIDSDNSDEYVKQLIRDEYITDSSVVVVLVGPKTWGRKHVDWEIYAGLYKKGGRSGLLGIMLPNHPDWKGDFDPDKVPPRFYDNWKTDYADFLFWTDDVNTMDEYIENAFQRRKKEDLIDNSRKQMKRNKAS